jgi:hypothetical protein
MTAISWAIAGLENLKVDWLVKALAVAGGAALGALFLGLLVQILVKLLSAQTVQGWPLRGTRLAGAVLGGWLVALWVFGGGGGGLGGLGGWGLGSGKGKGDAEEKKEEDPAKTKDAVKDGKKNGEDIAETLRVEVLGDETLLKIAKGKGFDPERRYRLGQSDERQLRTLREMEKRIKELTKTAGVQRLRIVLYVDGPDEKNENYVKPLEDWGRDALGVDKVDFDLSGKKAPE